MKIGKPVTILNITAPDRKRGGKVIPGEVREGENATITPGLSIRLWGTVRTLQYRGESIGASYYTNEPYSIEFRMGDTASYGSYNCTYLGTIIGVTEKRIIIAEDYLTRNQKNHSLTIYEFNWRHKGFDLESIKRHNAEMSQCI